MNDFNFLITFVEFYKRTKTVSDIPLSHETPPRSKVESLFQGIGNGSFKNDSDASNFLYNKPASHPAYTRLKKRLEWKLIQQLFLLDFLNENYYSRESRLFFEGLIQIIAVKVLIGIGNNYLTLPILKKGIKVAKKNKFPETGYLLTSVYLKLVKEYSLRGEKSLIESAIAQESKKFLESAKMEVEIELSYATIIGSLSKGGKLNSKEIQRNSEKLLSYSNKINKLSTLRVIEYYYALAAINIYKKEYYMAIDNCIKCIKQTKKSTISSIHTIYLLKAQCHIHLNDFLNATQAMRCAENNKMRPWANFFTFSDIYFILYSRSGAFGELIKLYDDTTSDPKFSSRLALANESWRQYGLLLLLLIKLDKIPPSERLERLKPKLRLGKLMNEMPEYSKDKAGLNLAIRILHVLILLASKKFGEFEVALDPLQSYIHRYKRHHPEIFRCDLMVKMLSIIPKVDYDVERTAWRAKPFLEKMIVPPEQLPLKITEMEVIPYEKTWEYMLEFLGTLKRRPYSSKAGD